VGEPALTLHVPDAAATEALGAAVAAALGGGGGLLVLRGELGTGKTTFVRGLLRRLGVTGSIRSPTYTLIEPYDAGGQPVHHLDLYRVSDPGELALMGTRDLLAEGGLVLVEWPERGGRSLPAPDLDLAFAHAPPGRLVELRAGSEAGSRVLAALRHPRECVPLP
jgi:tRNA threonylcarbamoyladenosine biosynthesis protein TsaE